MYIETVSVKNFRNLDTMSIELNKSVNIFYGKNAQGKTNIIEAVYMCATGRSHRTHSDKDMIMFGMDSAMVQTFINKDNYKDRVNIHLKKNAKKGIAVNNLPIKSLSELFGILHIVIFSPEDLELVKKGPSERRRFIDMELCQLSKIYCYNLQQYWKILKQRNNLLKQVQKNSSLRDTIFVWDSQLVDFGRKLIKEREKFTVRIDELTKDIHLKLTGGAEKMKIEYKPSVSADEFEEKLNKNIEKDIYFGSTSYGPHKDDLSFFINDTNVREFGSQGQQRCTAVSLKLAEIKLIEDEKGSEPVLLLDDVFSELDKNRQKYLIECISDIQTIITCTGIEDSLRELSEKAAIYMVENGKVYSNRDTNA